MDRMGTRSSLSLLECLDIDDFVSKLILSNNLLYNLITILISNEYY